jgi:hypothetical protein
MHPGSDCGALNFCGGKGRRYALERSQNVSLQIGSRVIPDYPAHQTLNQKLEGGEPQPFIVDMQASPPVTAFAVADTPS